MHTAIIVETSQRRARPVTPLDMIKKDAQCDIDDLYVAAVNFFLVEMRDRW